MPANQKRSVAVELLSLMEYKREGDYIYLYPQGGIDIRIHIEVWRKMVMELEVIE